MLTYSKADHVSKDGRIIKLQIIFQLEQKLNEKFENQN